jgi:hypothetical protein
LEYKSAIKQFSREGDLGGTINLFEGRIKINGENANYRLVVDQKRQEIVTFFKAGGEQ